MAVFPLNHRKNLPLPYSERSYYWIETGTEKGESVKNAIMSGDFAFLDSIEVNYTNFAEAKEKFQSFRNVTIHFGESSQVLRQLLYPIFRRSFPTVFWLDAHYSGGKRTEMDQRQKENGGVGECPLLREIDSIFSFSWIFPPVLLIDDAEMFQAKFWNEKNVAKLFRWEDWPSLSQIRERLPEGYQMGIQKEERNEVIYAWKQE